MGIQKVFKKFYVDSEEQTHAIKGLILVLKILTNSENGKAKISGRTKSGLIIMRCLKLPKAHQQV